jgi:hypothetical protein
MPWLSFNAVGPIKTGTAATVTFSEVLQEFLKLRRLGVLVAFVQRLEFAGARGRDGA